MWSTQHIAISNQHRARVFGGTLRAPGAAVQVATFVSRLAGPPLASVTASVGSAGAARGAKALGSW